MNLSYPTYMHTPLRPTSNKAPHTSDQELPPFAFIVGDHPVYVFITLLKAENPAMYRDIVPFLGPFHTQCVAIYKHYKRSELGDVLVAGGVIAEGSIEHALKGKHYKRGLRCLKLMYEALMSQLVKAKLTPNLAEGTRENLVDLKNTILSAESRATAHTAILTSRALLPIRQRAVTWQNTGGTSCPMTDALVQNVHAVHICNWDEYVSSLRAMTSWMVAFLKIRWPSFALSPSQATLTPTWSGTCGLNAP
jgi:hypothetical protein